MHIRILLDFLTRISSILTNWWRHFLCQGSMFWFIRKAADERMCLQPAQSTSQVCRSPSWRATSCLFQSILNQWQYYGPCDTILNAVLRSWYLSNWNKCVRRRAQVGLLSNRHCWRETRYLSRNWTSSYCTTSVTRQGPRLTWSKWVGEPGYCSAHPTVIQLDSWDVSLIPSVDSLVFPYSSTSLAVDPWFIFIRYFIYR